MWICDLKLAASGVVLRALLFDLGGALGIALHVVDKPNSLILPALDLLAGQRLHEASVGPARSG